MEELIVLQIILVAMKLTGIITLSWWIVMIPIMIIPGKHVVIRVIKTMDYLFDKFFNR